MNRSIRIAALGVLGAALTLPALAQTVKVTPLGGIDGEFCPQDRALIFEDPNGTRILYDPGRSVAGASDPRLGKIDIILVSHMHGDHAGNAHNKAPSARPIAEQGAAQSRFARSIARCGPVGGGRPRRVSSPPCTCPRHRIPSSCPTAG